MQGLRLPLQRLRLPLQRLTQQIPKSLIGFVVVALILLFKDRTSSTIQSLHAMKKSSDLCVMNPGDYACDRQHILHYCGDVCDPTKYNREASLPYDQLTLAIDCPALFSTDLFDQPAKIWPPPKEIPKVFEDDYTMDGIAEITDLYYGQKYNGKAKILDWSTEVVEEYIDKVKNGKFYGSYGKKTTQKVFETLQNMNLEGMRVLVIGSEYPWVEAASLASGAKEVYTVEYSPINATHPQMKTFHPNEFNQLFLEGKLPQFDVAIAYSSLEHSGLGRYGDFLNPWGDLIVSQRIRCVVKPQGKLVVGLPWDKDQDRLFWNAHRMYGKTRLPMFLLNWKFLERIPLEKQPIVIAERI
jgi:hypothetical protein